MTWVDGISDEGGYDRYEGPSLPDDWTLLMECEVVGEPWEFALVNVWQAPDGTLYGAADQGCSCPTPFTNLTPEGCKVITSVADLDPLLADSYYSGQDEIGVEQRADVAELKARVHRALRAAALGESHQPSASEETQP